MRHIEGISLSELRHQTGLFGNGFRSVFHNEDALKVIFNLPIRQAG